MSSTRRAARPDGRSQCRRRRDRRRYRAARRGDERKHRVRPARRRSVDDATAGNEAVLRGVVLGAHASYADRDGFGRRELGATCRADRGRGLLSGRCVGGHRRLEGGSVGYVKLHGALYHRAAVDEDVAVALARALAAIGSLRRARRSRIGPPGLAGRRGWPSRPRPSAIGPTGRTASSSTGTSLARCWTTRPGCGSGRRASRSREPSRRPTGASWRSRRRRCACTATRRARSSRRARCAPPSNGPG